MQSAPKLRFRSLRQAPEHASELAHWLHQERTRFGGAGTEHEGLAKLTAECADNAQLPHTKIALANNDLIGSVTLTQFHGPLAHVGDAWLTNLWVHPDWRRRGVGSALCNGLFDLARAHHVTKLQLFTYDQSSYYRAMGWTEVRSAQIAGRSCTVMSFVL